MEYRRVTLKDVAKEAGVSLMTVSYALRGSQKISAATRAKVEAAAAKLQYRPDPVMKRLASYRTNLSKGSRVTTLAWLNLHPSNESWKFRGSHVLESLEGAQQRAAEVGYHLETFNVHQLGGWTRTSAVLRARGIQGVIIGQPPAGTNTAKLDWNEFAVVAIGRAIKTPADMPRVCFNHVEAVFHLMSRLTHQGYRRIGLVMEREECFKNSYRNVAAYFGAAERLRMDPAERIPPLLPDKLDAAILGDWIRGNAVEVIMVHRPDQMQQLLPQLGLRVPDDIGYAHLSLHEPMEAVSGILFDPRHYGSWAVDMIHWLLEREEFGLREPSPTLTISCSQWNQGQSISYLDASNASAGSH